MPLERNLQKTVLRHLKKLAAEHPGRLVFRKRHGTAMGTSGDPDIYGVFYGLPFEIELKQPGQSPTRLQALRLEEWQNAGAIVRVVWCVEDLEALFVYLRELWAPPAA